MFPIHFEIDFLSYEIYIYRGENDIKTIFEPSICLNELRGWLEVNIYRKLDYIFRYFFLTVSVNYLKLNC